MDSKINQFHTQMLTKGIDTNKVERKLKKDVVPKIAQDIVDTKVDGNKEESTHCYAPGGGHCYNRHTRSHTRVG